MIANIALDDGLILPHSANPAGSNFQERQPLVRVANPLALRRAVARISQVSKSTTIGAAGGA
jgi:hypothetical protein